MIESNNKKEELIRLINNGLDLELISFELDIPIEQLEQLKLQTPKRKNSNTRKKEGKNIKRQSTDEKSKEIQEKTEKQDYEAIINKYKAEIIANPKSNEKRNLLAFAYFKSGEIDKARDELVALVEETSSYMAYRQLIHIEKTQGNYDDAKLWAYEAMDKFPKGIEIREQLKSIEREEKDKQER